ncbi:MAG: hypothetical protein ABI480_18280 [Chitinophagaceae bacterium]
MKASKAGFNLDHYKITRFSFNENATDAEAITVKFEPAGKYNPNTGIFILSSNFQASYGEKETELISATMESHFKFEMPVQQTEIPEYFYRNSIAIVFPYLRAFVSTLTSVANAKPLILPVMNLSALDEPLRLNTTII